MFSLEHIYFSFFSSLFNIFTGSFFNIFTAYILNGNILKRIGQHEYAFGDASGHIHWVPARPI